MGWIDLTWGSRRYKTIINNGSDRDRLNIAIVGDGYRVSERSTFNNDVDRVVDGFKNTEPIKTYFKHFNFHRINVFSTESGTSDRGEGVEAKTALNTYYSRLFPTRLLGPDHHIKTVVSRSGTEWDAILVIVNNNPYIGYACHMSALGPGRAVAYCTNVESLPNRMLHEAGHTIAKLFEEYDDHRAPDIDLPEGWTAPSVLPWCNVDTNPGDPKWRRWLTENVELPTPETAANNDVVGAFEGAAFTEHDVYRPQSTCKMKSPEEPFCKICREQWIKVIYTRTRISDSFTPRYTPPFPVQRTSEHVWFKANVIRTDDIRTTWYRKRPLHRNWSRQQQTSDYSNCYMHLPARRSRRGRKRTTRWQVKCVLEDRSSFIKSPVRRVAKQTYIWHVKIKIV